MPVKVVDASAVGAILFGEAEGADVGARLEGAVLTAPALLAFEVASICVKKLSRDPARRAAFLAAFALLERMEIATASVEHGEAVELAARSGLTAYDASYLWLARRLGAELVTLDRQLAAAAAAPG